MQNDREKEALRNTIEGLRHENSTLALLVEKAEAERDRYKEALEECKGLLSLFARMKNDFAACADNQPLVIEIPAHDIYQDFTVADIRRAASLVERLEKQALTYLNEEPQRQGLE